MSIFDVPNKFADDVERRLFKGWFDWSTWGDPITWIHHFLWALVFAGVGWVIGFMIHLQDLGATVGALVALVFYLAREGEGVWLQYGRSGWDRAFSRPRPERGRPYWVGWLVDGILDVVGPALVVWLLW